MRIALACAAGFLVIMDATIVAVGLPAMGAELGLGPAALPWVVNAYTLAFAGFLLLGGRIVDVLGVRAALLAGVVLFGAGSAAGGLAGSAAVLLAARAIQGVGGAVLLPASLAVIAVSCPPGPARTRALATWSAVGAAGATAGTVLGGLLTEWAGWRWVLLVVVPPAAVIAALAPRVLPGRPPGVPRPRLDVLGALLATAGMTALIDGLAEARPGAVPLVAGVLAAGAVLLALFALRQRRAPHPLVPPGILRLPGVGPGNVVMFVLGLGFFATPVLLAVALQEGGGYSAIGAAAAFVPTALALIAGGRIAGWTTVRWGPRRAATAGIVVATIGYAGLAVALAVPGGVAFVPLPGVLAGLGIGAAFTPITVVATTGVPSEHAGLAGGLLNTTRQFSGAVGLAGLSAVALAQGYGVALACACGCCAVAALLAPALLRGPKVAR